MIRRNWPDRKTALRASTAFLIVVSLGLSGCKTLRNDDALASSPRVAPLSAPDAIDETQARRDIEIYGERYRRDAKDSEAATRYARALRAIGQRAQAAAVLEQASINNVNDKALLGAYGRALADNGNFAQSLDVLNRAHNPDQPDWRILSVQGAVLDQLGRHEEARKHYASALRIAPEEPSVLSNLGLSHLLSKDLSQAEIYLRRANAHRQADRRVRQNLALVVGLRGQFEEAEGIARADLAPQEAAENVAYLKQMLAQHGAPERTKSPKAAAVRAMGS